MASIDPKFGHSVEPEKVEQKESVGSMSGKQVKEGHGASSVPLPKAVEGQGKDLTKGVQKGTSQKNNRIQQVKKRVLASAKIIGKGLLKIQEKGYPGRIVDSEYWFAEVVQRLEGKPRSETDILKECWEEDHDTHLSFKDWEGEKKKEWTSTKSGLGFLSWARKGMLFNQEKRAWQEENPGKVFSEEQLISWKKTQEDPLFGNPQWELKKMWQHDMKKKQPPISFAEWREERVKGITEFVKKWCTDHGATLSFSEFDKKLYEWKYSGSLLTPDQYILQDIWKKSGSKDPFPLFLEKMKHTKEKQAGKTTLSFEGWKEKAESDLRARYVGSGHKISYEKWLQEQNESLTTEPASFIRLDKNERERYLTRCDGGVLKRNGKIFDTQYEKTLHSGQGYAIFVIGPDEDLYCGSHIGGVFHHSSFLGDGAVMAGGEIQADKDGKITHLSNKSGHYTPTEKENLCILLYFQKRGVDLSKVRFSAYFPPPQGKEEYQSALEYLQKLQKKE